MKPRILMVNESSILNTGYSVYGREVLKRLHDSGKYEVAELATYVKPSDPRTQSIPWKVYANVPENENDANYRSSQLNEFGAYAFNDVCLDFKPHVVFDIRDYWMQQFLSESPFRKYFNLAILAPVDSEPQNEQWIDFYNDADGVFTYSEWGGKVLKKQCKTINFVVNAPPIASEEFFQIPEPEKKRIKHQLGLSEYSIIGTVMRNQRRKLFPDLFRSFRRFLDISKNTKTLLYCHTHYPDLGWEIPKLLLQYGISNRVLFTYVCCDEKCKHVSPGFYTGQIIVCHKCNQPSMMLSGVHVGAENPVLNFVYNSMDLYIQYSLREGWAMPILEAAACGTPVCGLNYSAMAENVSKLGGYVLDTVYNPTEIESGVFSALPDEDQFVRLLLEINDMTPEEKLAKREETLHKFKENYGSWDVTANKWMTYFDSLDIQKYEDRWNAPKYIHEPVQPENKAYGNVEFVNFLMEHVLGDKSKIGSYMAAKMVKDLICERTHSPGNDKYYSEDSMRGGARTESFPFNKQRAFEMCVGMCNFRNYWENRR